MTSDETKMTLVFPSWTDQWQIPENPNWFEVEVEIRTDTDLREVVLGLLDSLPNEFVPYRSIGSKGSIPFDFATGFKTHETESRGNFKFLPYGRFHRGGVEFLHVLRRAHRSWSINEIKWLRDEQLLDEVPNKFYVVFLQGLGAAGGPQDWIDAIFEIAGDPTLNVVRTYLVREALKFSRRFRNSLIMKDWRDRGLDSVDTLDLFLATRASWAPRDLSKLLHIWNWESTRLLARRGFQLKPDKTWTKIIQGPIDVGLADLV